MTDVTEFKYYIGSEIRKLYLSAILDLYDKRIVAYKIGDSNNNRLVFDTFDETVFHNSGAHPLFHSDRGFQYTSKAFYNKLQAAKIRQSMSRVGRCIDNGPMESFWGMLKSEMYYLHRFTDRGELIRAIDSYIHFYNNGRFQKRLRCMTPMEFSTDCFVFSTVYLTGGASNIYGYARVGAKDQNEERQLIALADAGVDEKNIYGQAVRQGLQSSAI